MARIEVFITDIAYPPKWWPGCRGSEKDLLCKAPVQPRSRRGGQTAPAAAPNGLNRPHFDVGVHTIDAAMVTGLEAAALRAEHNPAARAYTQALASSPFVRMLLAGQLPFEWAVTRMVSDDPRKGLGRRTGRRLALAASQGDSRCAGEGSPPGFALFRAREDGCQVPSAPWPGAA